MMFYNGFMKQIIQSFSKGKTEIIDIPTPKVKENQLLIKSSISLLSKGTEKMLVDFGKSNYFEKARQQPEKVKEVINKAITDGIPSTFEAVKSKLEEPFPLGYCNVGKVIDLGSKVKNFNIGDRVVSNGPHSEIFTSTENLCAKIPESVSDEEAAFTVISSICLHGIRLAKPTFGETFLVSGLGLIGLITTQLLKANGCNVLGIDPDPRKCSVADSLGIKTIILNENNDPIKWCLNLTNNIGVDGSLIAASTPSSNPINLASEVTRKNGRIIQIGSTGLNLKREEFYKKELNFKVSCSYGPGRYDPIYETKGIDYPINYVRWTEKRNFSAILDALDKKILDLKPLITHKFPFHKALDAYTLLSSKEHSLAILFIYPSSIPYKRKVIFPKSKNISLSKIDTPVVSFIGAGNFSGRQLIPAFKRAGADLFAISSLDGLKPYNLAKKFSFKEATTDIDYIFDSEEVNTIVIATRHDSHYKYVKKALLKGKNVYVEKPLCLNKIDLHDLERTLNNTKNKFLKKNLNPPILMVGFNRRFAPLIVDLKKKLSHFTSPKSFIFTCNAGYLPPNHWINDVNVGGGRLIGEACHFVDLLRYLVGFPITSIKLCSGSIGDKNPENFILNLIFTDGSIGTINYFSNGNKSYQKERLEVFCNQKVFQINNFRKSKTWGARNMKNRFISFQDKGHLNCVKSFLSSIKKGSDSPISENEIFEIHSSILDVIDS